MSRDSYVTIGSLLTPEEAGMARDLLVSEGVDALLEDQALSAVDPLVRLAIGGTKLLVRQEDAERARSLLDGAGVLAPASARPTEDVVIPEEEWSAPLPEQPREESDWPGIKVVVLIIVLIVAAAAVLAESSRPHWPPWGH